MRGARMGISFTFKHEKGVSRLLACIRQNWLDRKLYGGKNARASSPRDVGVPYYNSPFLYVRFLLIVHTTALFHMPAISALIAIES